MSGVCVVDWRISSPVRHRRCRRGSPARHRPGYIRVGPSTVLSVIATLAKSGGRTPHRGGDCFVAMLLAMTHDWRFSDTGYSLDQRISPSSSLLAQAITWLIDWSSCSRVHIDGMIARLNICTAMSGGAG